MIDKRDTPGQYCGGDFSVVCRSMFGPPLAKRLGTARRILIDRNQRVAKRISTSHLELRYQANYFEVGRRTPWLDDLPVSSLKGGTAGYSLLYVLLSLLRSGSFINILELGVGQSTRLIAPYVAADPERHSVHVEHDATWLEAVVPNSSQIERLYAPLTKMSIDGREIEWYDCDQPNTKFDLVLVDGPAAWQAPDRYSRLGVLKWLPEILADDFVICFDDVMRVGERRLVTMAEQILTETRPTVQKATFTGATSQTLFATSLYQSAIYI